MKRVHRTVPTTMHARSMRASDVSGMPATMLDRDTFVERAGALTTSSAPLARGPRFGRSCGGDGTRPWRRSGRGAEATRGTRTRTRGTRMTTGPER